MADATREPSAPILSRLSPPAGAVPPKKRKGRGPGSGVGKRAGRGQKGQTSRSGRKLKEGFEGGQMPLQRRLPKVGFRNLFRKNVATVNVATLGRFDAGTVVEPESLVRARMIRKRYDLVKVLGTGELDRALTVRAHAFSTSARAKIEKAGGTVELIDAGAGKAGKGR